MESPRVTSSIKNYWFAMTEISEKQITQELRDKIQAKVVYFLTDELGDHEKFTPETRLLSSGLLDSLATVRLITFVENEYNIALSPFDISTEKFDSVNLIVEQILIKTHTNG